MAWVRFGGVLMSVTGAFAVIEGILALSSPRAFLTVDGTVLSVDTTAWGWLHLVLGALVLLAGLSLLGAAADWARVTGTVLVSVNMVVQLAFLPAHPIWSLLLLALQVLVLYALLVTWFDEPEV